MTSEDRSEGGLRFAGKLVDKLCMQTTHSYVEAHRNITPRSNRVNTEPTAIDPAIYNIIASRSPNATRIRRLLPSSRPVARKSTSKLETEVFQRAYSRQRQRVLTQVQGEEDRKRKLREKLGLGRKELPSFYKFDRDKLNYMEQRMAPQQGRYHQKLHPVCRLYQEYSERVSLRPHCLENPFERIT